MRKRKLNMEPGAWACHECPRFPLEVLVKFFQIERVSANPRLSASQKDETIIAFNLLNALG
jgi:hypothetical protein